MPRTTRSLEERFWAKVRKSDGGCWLWLGAQGGAGAKIGLGYGKIRVAPGVLKSAHRVMWEISCGPIPDGMCVLHSCDNPTCVRLEHLFLGSQSENVLDMVSKGRHSNGPKELRHGANNGRSKLSWDQVREMRLLHSRGWLQERLSQKFAISETSVSVIVRGLAWKETP